MRHHRTVDITCERCGKTKAVRYRSYRKLLYCSRQCGAPRKPLRMTCRRGHTGHYVQRKKTRVCNLCAIHVRRLATWPIRPTVAYTEADLVELGFLVSCTECAN